MTETDSVSGAAQYEDHPIVERSRNNDKMDAERVKAVAAEYQPRDMLGGVWGHGEFFRAVLDEVGVRRKDDRQIRPRTAFYDNDKAVGGDGMSTGPVDKRNVNTMDVDGERHVAVVPIRFSDEEQAGRFIAVADEYDWAVEWGFNKKVNAHRVDTPSELTVYVAPSDFLDY